MLRGLDTIAIKNTELAAAINSRGGCILHTELPAIVAIDRLMPLLVRCGAGRFTCPAQDAEHFIRIINQHRKVAEALKHDIDADYVRDVSLPAA